jgi:dTDP-4-dehydrorhamnose 3,5-epimerase-like enzyme
MNYHGCSFVGSHAIPIRHKLMASGSDRIVKYIHSKNSPKKTLCLKNGEVIDGKVHLTVGEPNGPGHFIKWNGSTIFVEDGASVTIRNMNFGSLSGDDYALGG